METDYSHYAIVHELQQKGQETNTGLQLLSGCRSGNGHPWLPREGHGHCRGAGAGLPTAAQGHQHQHPMCWHSGN